ncbi:gp46 [Bacillus phage G]|uniref:Gp46 n=1 Tax=Bacillus phage G TaxID=2884420 RepID=G3MBB6_9CAUD|nr:gp46 [Bacillus phage G]AEO93317.1 gp46 [Bacillus phage G]
MSSFEHITICPICQSELSKQIWTGEGWLEELYLRCENKCFYYSFSYGDTRISVFDKEVEYSYNEKDKSGKEKIVEKMIKYWKENDRYLAKLIKGISDEES